VISKQQEKFGGATEMTTTSTSTLSTSGLSEKELERRTDELFQILDSKRKEKEAKRYGLTDIYIDIATQNEFTYNTCEQKRKEEEEVSSAGSLLPISS